MSELKSDRMLDALERLEAIKEGLKHDGADISNHLHMAIETLKDALAQQLLHERRRQSPVSAELPGDTCCVIKPVVVKGYNDEPPERSTLGHTGRCYG